MKMVVGRLVCHPAVGHRDSDHYFNDFMLILCLIPRTVLQ